MAGGTERGVRGGLERGWWWRRRGGGELVGRISICGMHIFLRGGGGLVEWSGVDRIGCVRKDEMKARKEWRGVLEE